VLLSSGPRLPTKVGSDAATCPMAPGSASSRGGLLALPCTPQPPAGCGPREKNKRLRRGRLKHNITQFSRGRRVLHLGGPNHVNQHSPGANNEEAKGLPHKRTTAGCSCGGSGGSVAKPLRHLACQEGGTWCFSENKASTTPSRCPHDDVVAS
jgi:hypothetical protein